MNRRDQQCLVRHFADHPRPGARQRTSEVIVRLDTESRFLAEARAALRGRRGAAAASGGLGFGRGPRRAEVELGIEVLCQRGFEESKAPFLGERRRDGCTNARPPVRRPRGRRPMQPPRDGPPCTLSHGSATLQRSQSGPRDRRLKRVELRIQCERTPQIVACGGRVSGG